MDMSSDHRLLDGEEYFPAEFMESLPMEKGFVVTHLSRLRYYYELWQEFLPQVEIHYAVKAFNHPEILSYLYKLGCKFDVASLKECRDCFAVGARSSELLSSHPYKTCGQIDEYRRLGIQILTVDCEEELEKIADIYPGCSVMIRVKSSLKKKAIFCLDEKFGATTEEAKILLARGLSLGLNMIGLSFHVGSCQEDTSSHGRTITNMKSLFTYCHQELGHEMKILNLGGGFPGGHQENKFVEMATNITKALDDCFPPSQGVRIIAEPGTYFADPSTDIYACVIGKKKFKIDDLAKRNVCVVNGPCYSHGFSYILNDGVYGSLEICHYLLGFKYWSVLGAKTGDSYPSILWGPTCDSQDKVCDMTVIPEMAVGTWLVRKNSGSYSLELKTGFNGIPSPTHLIIKEDRRRSKPEI